MLESGDQGLNLAKDQTHEKIPKALEPLDDLTDPWVMAKVRTSFKTIQVWDKQIAKGGLTPTLEEKSEVGEESAESVL